MDEIKRCKLEEAKERVAELMGDIAFPDPVMQPIWFGRRPTQMIAGKNAIIDQRIVRMNKELDAEHQLDPVFGICSDNYQLVYHEQVICDVLRATEKLPELGTPVIEPIFIDDGRKAKFHFLFPDVKYEVAIGTPYQSALAPQFLALNSYDLGWEFSVKAMARQQVCSNGMFALKAMGHVRGRHNQSLDVGNLVDQIEQTIEGFSEQIGLWNDWSQKMLTAPEFAELVEALPFGGKYSEQILQLPIIGEGKSLNEKIDGKGVTLWDVHNAVTQFVEHEIGSEVVKLDKGEVSEHIFERFWAKHS